MRIEGALFKFTVALLQLLIVAFDLVLFTGFLFMNGASVVLPAKISLIAMCIADPLIFTFSWFRPKESAFLIAVTVAITVALSCAASDKHSLGALVLPGAFFWGLKLTIAYALWPKDNKPSAVNYL